MKSIFKCLSALILFYSGFACADAAKTTEISKIKYLELAFTCDQTGKMDLGKITAMNYQIDRTAGGRIGNRLGGMMNNFRYPMKIDNNTLKLSKSPTENVAIGKLNTVPSCQYDETGYFSGFTGASISSSVEMKEYYMPDFLSCAKYYSGATGDGWLRTNYLSVTFKELGKPWTFSTHWDEQVFFHSQKECLAAH